ncbi:hypothetical protein [Calidifontibacter terrae]
MDQAPIGRTITLSHDFVESLTPQQLQGYIAALDAVAGGDHRKASEIETALAQRLATANVRMPPVELRRIAEQFAGRGDASLRVVSDEGLELLNHPGRSSLEPTETQHADPADPDRPAAV